MSRYIHITEYIKAWDQGKAEARLKMLLEHGALTPQQQFQLNHKEAYEHFHNIADIAHQRSKKP